MNDIIHNGNTVVKCILIDNDPRGKSLMNLKKATVDEKSAGFHVHINAYESEMSYFMLWSPLNVKRMT